METNCYDGPYVDENPQKKTDDLARNIIEQIADKWTILVIDALGTHGEMRFSRLREEIGGVSQKMLTKTLRQLERDGLVSRYVHPVIPPRVDYQLTPLGRSLLDNRKRAGRVLQTRCTLPIIVASLRHIAGKPDESRL